MAERGKKIALEGDIISNLPINVITQILDFLHVHDLARTSVLSRNWRYIWASHPNIKIGYDSLESKKIKNGCIQYIINKILLQHIGPVLKFSLRFPMPPCDDEVDLSLVDNWLLYLSRNGINELTLHCATKEPYTLPSHIFHAPELVVLNLTKCVFNSSNEHAEFRKLKILNLCNIDFQFSKVTSPLDTPQLTHLTFKYCIGVCHFKIRAPKLKIFVLDKSEDFDLIGFEMPEITTIALMLWSRRGDFKKKISLTELFERWRLISNFYVDGISFKYLVAGTSHQERLPSMTNCVKHLVIRNIYWGDLHQISCIIYLLRISTTLSRLDISAGIIEWNKYDANEVSNYFDATHSMNWTIDSLEIVMIDPTNGSENEMRFIKLLLSRCPRLKKMFVKERKFNNDDGIILKLAKRLMQLPRAAKEAEIILEPNVKVAELSKISSLG